MSNPYSIVQNIHIIENESHIGYGIEYSGEDGLILLEDIACHNEELAELIRLCNTLSLSPIHLSDVVEDFLLTLPK